MWNSLISKIRGWMGMIFNKNKRIQEIVDTQVSEEHYKKIEHWKAIYAGYFEDWHTLTYNTINNPSKKRRMHTLGMAKIATQELAKIIFSEKVEININDNTFSENIKNVLDMNRFHKVFQGKIENMFALGGLIMKVIPRDNPDGTYRLTISYVTPDCFIPITYENDEVTEGVFITVTKKGKKTYYLFEFHRWNNTPEKRVYTITNELYVEDTNGSKGTSESAKQTNLNEIYPDLEEETNIDNLEHPLFQYIKPNISNNFDLQSPLGISLFANSMDTLYAIDVAFDSFIREFRLGKRRIIVPASAVRVTVDPDTGDMKRYFDADDESYQAFNYEDSEKQKIHDNTVDLRVDEHISAINALLNLYSMQIGLSTGTFTFDGQGIKTATEVVSENSKTYQTKQINEQYIEESLIKFIKTIGEVADLYDVFDNPDDVEIEIAWDDTIVKDKYTDSDFYIKLKNNGLMSAKKAIIAILDVTEEQAIEILSEIKDEEATANPDITSIIGGAE